MHWFLPLIQWNRGFKFLSDHMEISDFPVFAFSECIEVLWCPDPPHKTSYPAPLNNILIPGVVSMHHWREKKSLLLHTNFHASATRLKSEWWYRKVKLYLRTSWKHKGKWKVQFQTFLTSILDMRLWGPQFRSEYFSKKIFCPYWEPNHESSDIQPIE